MNDFRPNILANYLFELANSFHAFYEACPVLKSEEPVRASRLALSELTGRVLQRGLDLLGIKVPEKDVTVSSRVAQTTRDLAITVLITQTIEDAPLACVRSLASLGMTDVSAHAVKD